MKKLLLLLLLAMLLGCNSKVKLVTIYTNLTDVVPYIEEFNRQNRTIKILLKTDSPENSDMVIFKGHRDQSPYSTEDITNFFDKNFTKEQFFEDILRLGLNSNENLDLIPLSFDIPGLVYNRARIMEQRDIDIDEFIKRENTLFSPFWNSSFIFYDYLINQPELTTNNSYVDLKKLTKSISESSEYINNQKSLNIRDFNSKYLYMSPETLLSKNLIDYYFYNLSDYIELKKDKSYKNISFAFLERNDLIYGNSDVVFVGINSESKNKDTSKDVLIWLFNPANQAVYIRNSINLEPGVKLFNGGLSTLKDVTYGDLPKYYSDLESLLPDRESITIPQNLPDLWSTLRREVYIPLLNDSYNYNEEQTETKYRELFTEWSKRHNK